MRGVIEVFISPARNAEVKCSVSEACDENLALELIPFPLAFSNRNHTQIMADTSFAADSQQSIDKLQKAYTSIKTQMSQVIVGQEEVIE